MYDMKQNIVLVLGIWVYGAHVEFIVHDFSDYVCQVLSTHIFTHSKNGKFCLMIFQEHF